MKKQLIIIFMSLVFIFGIAFFIFQNQKNSISVNLDNYSSKENLQTLSFNINLSINYNGKDYSNISSTKSDAVEALNESELIIAEMQQHNFSIVYMNDTLIEAKRYFDMARYAEILRNPNSSYLDRKEAEQALRLVNWKKMDYNEVLKRTDEIKLRKNAAYYFQDTISSIYLVLEDYSKKGVDLNTSLESLSEARKSFYEDRYNDTINYLEITRDNLESTLEKRSTTNILGNNVKTFIWRNKYYILSILIILLIIGYISYRKISVQILKNKIIKLRIEKQGLVELEKKTQEERFKENKISGLVYNIRMKKYNTRLEQIKEELPVLEDKLKTK